MKKVFVRSGIRYDYLIEDKNEEFFEELVKHHISGQLKVAPEHCSDRVLDCMGKPHFSIYRRFYKRFYELNKKFGMDQYLVPYMICLLYTSGCKHAGFGLGFERLIMYITGVSNIRDVLPFPRTLGSAEF